VRSLNPSSASLGGAVTGREIAARRDSTDRRARRAARAGALRAWLTPGSLALALTVGVIGGAVAFGLAKSGRYGQFVAQTGGVENLAARLLGFGVDRVSLNGLSQLEESVALSAAGVRPTQSLPFFDAEAARARLEALPIVQHASVRKLYPDRIVIDIVERSATALWQKDGVVHTIAAEGAVIDDYRGTKLADLPFVVGDDANLRLSQYLRILDALAEVKPRVAAGVLIEKRRWNLKLVSGLEIKLPEDDPVAAAERLVALQRRSRILDRDVLEIDLRAPDRVFVRLTEEAADVLSEAHAKKGAAL